MGITRNSYFWCYATCATRYIYNMHGTSRFNGIFYPGRRRNYQTFCIPSRLALAPMSFYLRKKDYAFTIKNINIYYVMSKNSMALWIRYAKFCSFFFKTLDYVSREEYEIKGIPDFYLSGVHFSVTNFFYTKRLLILT